MISVSAGGRACPSFEMHPLPAVDLYLGKVELEVKAIERLEGLVQSKRARQLDQVGSLTCTSAASAAPTRKSRPPVVLQLRLASGSHVVREQRRRLEAHALVVKRRLDRGLALLDATAAATRALRETIDELKQERAVLEGVRASLERDTRLSTRALSENVETAKQAHEACDIADLDASRLEASLAKERSAFEAGLTAVDGAIDVQVSRAMREVMHMRGQLTMAEESVLQGALSAGRSALERDTDAAKKAHARVRLFEAVFTQLSVRHWALRATVRGMASARPHVQESRAVPSFDGLVEHISRGKDATFALFARAATQSFELQCLEERSRSKGSRVTVLLDMASAGSLYVAEQRQRAALNVLQDALALQSATAARSEAALGAQRTLLEDVRSATETLARAVGAFESLPGARVSGATLDDSSILAALSLVELRAHDLLDHYAAAVMHAAGGGEHAGASQPALRPHQGTEFRSPDGAAIRMASFPRRGVAVSREESARRTAVVLLGLGPVAPPRSASESESLADSGSGLPKLPAVSPTRGSRGGGGLDDGDSSDTGDVRPLKVSDIRRQLLASHESAARAFPAVRVAGASAARNASGEEGSQVPV